MSKMKATEVDAHKQRIMREQNFLCALCDVSFLDKEIKNGKIKPKFTPVLDHDHSTGQLRGVLCNNCNGAEGKVRTQAIRCQRRGTPLEWLERLCVYLREHKESDADVVLHHTHKTEDDKRLRRNKLARQRYAKKKAEAAANALSDIQGSDA